jgi:hypothetical protein
MEGNTGRNVWFYPRIMRRRYFAQRPAAPVSAQGHGHSQKDFEDMAVSLNGRPRATLDWDCPLYFYEKMLALSHVQPASVQ